MRQARSRCCWLMFLRDGPQPVLAIVAVSLGVLAAFAALPAISGRKATR